MRFLWKISNSHKHKTLLSLFFFFHSFLSLLLSIVCKSHCEYKYDHCLFVLLFFFFRFTHIHFAWRYSLQSAASWFQRRLCRITLFTHKNHDRNCETSLISYQNFFDFFQRTITNLSCWFFSFVFAFILVNRELLLCL